MLPKLKRETGSFQDMLHLRIPTKKSLSDQEDKDDSSSPRSPSDGATVTQHVQKNTGNVKKKRHSGLHYFFHSHSHQHHKESKFFIEDMDSQEKRKSLTLSDPLHNRKVASPTSSLTSLQSKRPKWHLKLHPPSAPHISHRRRKSISGIVEPPEPPPQLVPYTPVHAASAIQKLAPPVQRISRRAASEDGTAAVGLVDGPDLKVENATTDVLRSVSEQNALLNALPSERILRRRSSCPALERPIEHLKKHTPKCQRVLSIADVQHRSQISGDTLLKRTSPSGSPGTSSPTSPQHRQTHTRPQPSKSLHERASKLYPLPHPRRCNSTGRVSNVTVSRQSSEDSGSNGSTKTSPATKIPNVIDPVTGREVIRFSDIQPRSVRLRRRVSEKKEAKALNKWRATVQAALDEHAALLEKQQLMPPKTTIPPEKKHKYALTRRFILREFYTTEVTFWNQLYYSKVMFHDALTAAVSRRSAYVKKADADLFANLFDLLQFSAKFLNRLQCIQFERVVLDKPFRLTPSEDYALQCPSDLCIGKTMCDLAEDMVVFLRCALDYKANMRQVVQSRNNKGYMLYKEKLYERKETRQFTIEDYMIIPIQRIARYNLLLTDLLKHTPSSDPDYNNICTAQKIVDGLASAMNYAQK